MKIPRTAPAGTKTVAAAAVTACIHDLRPPEGESDESVRIQLAGATTSHQTDA